MCFRNYTPPTPEWCSPSFQYAYTRNVIYCRMDESVTDITGLGFWLILDGDISAPQCLPIGSSKGHDRFGPTYHNNFISRESNTKRQKELQQLAEQLIDEILQEEQLEHLQLKRKPHGRQ